MSDLISLEAAWEAIKNVPLIAPDRMAFKLQRALWDVPAVDAVPVVHGEWIQHGMDISEHPNRCSVCSWGNHHIDRVVADFKFCPNCGAKMDGGGKQDG